MYFCGGSVRVSWGKHLFEPDFRVGFENGAEESAYAVQPRSSREALPRISCGSGLDRCGLDILAGTRGPAPATGPPRCPDSLLRDGLLPRSCRRYRQRELERVGLPRLGHGPK